VQVDATSALATAARFTQRTKNAQHIEQPAEQLFEAIVGPQHVGMVTRLQKVAAHAVRNRWRERHSEEGFIVRRGRSVTAIETKSGRLREMTGGLDEFAKAFKPQRSLLIIHSGDLLDRLLENPFESV
jgi:hypothetical protein